MQKKSSVLTEKCCEGTLFNINSVTNDRLTCNVNEYTWL